MTLTTAMTAIKDALAAEAWTGQPVAQWLAEGLVRETALPAPVDDRLTAAAFLAALMACKGGETLTVKPGEVIPGYIVRGKAWAEPVIIMGDGATFERPHYWDCEGVAHIGGKFVSPFGMLGTGTNAYALWFRGCKRVSVTESEFTDAVRGLVIAECEDVIVADNYFGGLVSEGINLGTIRRAHVTRNKVRDFHPLPLNHPDAIQMFGRWIEDVLIEHNDIEGDMQSIGVFNGSYPKVRPQRVRINYNRCRSPRSWGISLQNGDDCEVIGNDMGRTPGGTAKVQINVTGSNGRFAGNSNPDAPAGHVSVQALA